MRWLFLLPADKSKKKEKELHVRMGFRKRLETKKDSLYHDVMEGHDVGMSKMGKISGYLKTVKGSLDSLKTSKKPDKNRISLLESISADLNQADYSMNRWMEEFKPDSAENNEPVRLAYLESEKDKISRIKDRILNALTRADSLYGSKSPEISYFFLSISLLREEKISSIVPSPFTFTTFPSCW